MSEKTVKTILVADDLLPMRDIMAELLQDTWPQHINVVTVGSPHQAARAILAGGIDLLLTDRNMPKYADGDELVKALRAQGYTLPCIMFSADPPSAAAAEKIGLQAVFMKDQGAAIIAKIRELLQLP